MSEEEGKEAPKGAEDLLFEYFRDNRADAYGLFLNILNNLRKIIAEANADVHDKVDAAFLLGRIAEDIELIELSVVAAEQNTHFYYTKADNGTVEAVKALLKVYAALEKSPLYDINEDLTDFSYELSKAVKEYIEGLTKWFRATEEALDKALSKAAAQGSSA
jgi:hypothetical protein